MPLITSTPFSHNIIATAVPINFSSTATIDAYNGDFSVDWGDGNFINYSAGNPATASAVPSGNITIKSVTPVDQIQFVTNTFSAIDIVDGSDLTSADSMCLNLTNLTTFNGSNMGGITDFNFAWFGCSSLTSFPLIDTSAVINFSRAWNGCTSLTSFPLIDTSSGTDFSFVWRGCSSLISMPAIDTSSGTDFTNTWTNCFSLVCLSSVNTLLQTITLNMFLNTTALINPTSSEQTSIEAGFNYVNGNACP